MHCYHLCYVRFSLLSGIRCHALTAPAHGNMSESTFTFKETVEFHCDRGYVLQGSRVRECLNTGLWDGQNAICKRM